MFKKIVEAKGILIGYLEQTDFDLDSIEYLIDTFDYLLTGKIPASVDIIDIIIQDVIVTSTYHRGKHLLQVAKLLKDFKEELTCTT